MKCEVYRSNRKAGTYLFVADAEDLGNLPDDLKARLEPLEWVMAIDLAERDTLAATRPATVIDSIESRGFFLQLPPGEETDSC
ncbi:MAG: YcgL domain-containing protein [Pseudomonadota bacterium]|nr:YcgL domain-containing protein [Pseudomonadota bacterium]